MNAITSQPDPRLPLDIMYDLICPWCYLGIRRLLRTVRARPGAAFQLHWRPFLLNPDMPRTGMTRQDYVIRTFGGEDRARRLYASISALGRAEDLVFQFDRIRRTPSSVNAHRLVRWAGGNGDAADLVEALFAAHFAHGKDISDPDTLAAIAGGQGFDRAEACAYLTSTKDVDAIHADNLRAHRLGVNGVPCFIIAGRHAIAGAQEPEVIERMLDVASVEQGGR